MAVEADKAVAAVRAPTPPVPAHPSSLDVCASRLAPICGAVQAKKAKRALTAEEQKMVDRVAAAADKIVQVLSLHGAAVVMMMQSERSGHLSRPNTPQHALLRPLLVLSCRWTCLTASAPRPTSKPPTCAQRCGGRASPRWPWPPRAKACVGTGWWGGGTVGVCESSVCLCVFLRVGRRNNAVGGRAAQLVPFFCLWLVVVTWN